MKDPANSLPQYCDVSLPVPLDQAFTYSLPETLRHRVQPGCRVLAPFGARKLIGFALRCHSDPPTVPVKPVLRLLDKEPALDEDLLQLARWVAEYYCAPLGEVLRGMAPLAGEVRRTKVYSLTGAGRDAMRQLALISGAEDPAVELLRSLEHRALSAVHLQRKVAFADRLLKTLERKEWVQVETGQAERDPLRAPSAKLRVELTGSRPEGKLNKAERELAAFLELHPGAHNLKEVEGLVAGAGAAARALARRGLLTLRYEPLAMPVFPMRPPHQLNPAQEAAFGRIREHLHKGEFHAFLLHGVTGSGKTEIYLRAIDETLACGRSALMLVPEIALTPAVAGQFYHRFGERVAILHSAFTDVERAEQWRRIRAGDAPVVVGTRSGVFAPVRNLGLIVVDEEHDQSYKQDETPRYNGRDVAVVRAQMAGACVVLGSATPALETRYNAQRGKYELLLLPERIEQRPLPQVELIDMRTEFLETRSQSVFSRALLQAIRQRLDNGEQCMLLLNRRGFSSFVTCRQCGERIQCVNCAVTLTYHRRDRRLLCHYCNYAEQPPEVCPKCESDHIYYVGTGSEKVESELHRHFPRARVARLDRDTVGGKREYEAILQSFREGSYDILVGTQMIAKGHDIPNVTLVGVVSADIGLALPDFRSAERTFQLLTQVAGRAGRGDVPGVVLIQTLNPDHYAIRMAAAQNYDAFFQKELQFRRSLRYPPFCFLASVLVRSQSAEEALRLSTQLGMLLEKPQEGLKIVGPAEAYVPRLKNEYRYQLLIKSAGRKLLRETLLRIRHFATESRWGATTLAIDADPLSLL